MLTPAWPAPRCLATVMTSLRSHASRQHRSLQASAITAQQSPPQTYRYPYHWIADAEDLEKYRPGGYHPVMIGHVLGGGCYQIVDKLTLSADIWSLAIVL